MMCIATLHTEARSCEGDVGVTFAARAMRHQRSGGSRLQR